eukprot:CAMPEP_0116917274 /NCGR_PEP_ID=MMETSP0467-20121206/19039_1 /TAXON_ID=283647 /ORGANISM="Mesodinium pulex, Strain SPMC105" /LENGTH=259 /DNA_ID=CAMNT_0004594323 /DNA_START=913 /DNA_END=1692 /DNA_ORIENTATION=-
MNNGGSISSNSIDIRSRAAKGNSLKRSALQSKVSEIPDKRISAVTMVETAISPKLMVALEKMGYKVQKIKNSVNSSSETKGTKNGKEVLHRARDSEERIDNSPDMNNLKTQKRKFTYNIDKNIAFKKGVNTKNRNKKKSNRKASNNQNFNNFMSNNGFNNQIEDKKAVPANNNNIVKVGNIKDFLSQNGIDTNLEKREMKVDSTDKDKAERVNTNTVSFLNSNGINLNAVENNENFNQDTDTDADEDADDDQAANNNQD